MGKIMTVAATSEGNLGPSAPSPETRFLDVQEVSAAGSVCSESCEELCDESLEDGESDWSTKSESDTQRTLDEEFMESQVALVDSEGLRAMGERSQALGYLWVLLESPGPQHRGRLGLYLEEAIEQQLEDRGALPPGIQASTGLDASLSDQLYRARLLEMRGIALGIPSLEGITNLGRSLDADDSAVLRWWIAAAAQRPVQLVISNENTKLRVYPSPVLFETLFEVAQKPVTPRPPSLPMAESSQSMELSDLPPDVELTNMLGTEVATVDPLYDQDSSEESDVGLDDGRATLIDVDLPDLDRALGLVAAEPAPVEEPAQVEPLAQTLPSENSEQLPLAHEDCVSAEVPTQNEGHRPILETRIASPAPPPEMEQKGKAFDAPYLGDLDEDEFLRTLKEDSEKAPEVEALPVEKEDLPSTPVLASTSEVPTKRFLKNPFIRMANPREAIAGPSGNVAEQKLHEPTLAGAAAPDPNDPFNQLAAREWKTWVKNLEAARGPKPLSVIERMFVTEYTRLREAVRRGVAPSSAASILDEWQHSFEKSYSEAFDALRVRGKRPTMVLDLPEMAARLGRLQGAKRVQLLLVDGLRFDLGLMVQDRMRERADAALTERLLLWSALPSVTQYQLELLGKGPDGLKESGDSDEPPALVARGPAARVPRRLRTGHLELYKLDIVEDCLRESGVPILERMDAIAEETSHAICDYLSKQAPRTMVVVFGDHGFRLDPKKAGTSEEASQGGSSPEEVLVPAFAWLTGAVH
jgi:hypothetical protein